MRHREVGETSGQRGQASQGKEGGTFQEGEAGQCYRER